MGGLQNVANILKVKRIGAQHQAGSDSLLTGQVFFKIYEKYFSSGLDDVKYSGQICGFNGCMPVPASSSNSHYASAAITSSAYITDHQEHYVDMDDIQSCGSPLRIQ
jgi:CCR4-NOT transcription complex subunit 7/8